MHPLFTVDAMLVTRQLLEEFLSLAVAEGLTVEYKGDFDTLEEVAAMANTYGGLVLAGVPHRGKDGKELPGTPIGVPLADRQRMLDRMANMYSPPYTPEVIPVAVGGDRYVLVVRVDSDRAPRPIMYQGRIPVRREARNGWANLTEIRALLDEQGTYIDPWTLSASHAPSAHYPVIRSQMDDPSVVVRAFTSADVLRRVARPRLDRAAHEALASGLMGSRLPMHVAGMAATYRSGGAIADRWHEHRRYTSSRQFRLWLGTTNADNDDWPVTQPGIRADCFAAINGIAVDLGVDLSFWIEPSHKVLWRDVAQSAYETVFALVEAHQALLCHVVGQGMYPLPPIQLHIEPGMDPADPTWPQSTPDAPLHRKPGGLASVVDLAELGGPARPAEELQHRAAEILSRDLVDAGDLNGAVEDAINLMLMDWGFHAKGS